MNLDAERQRLLGLAEKATPPPWGLTGSFKNDPRGHYPIANCGNGASDETVGVEAPVQDYCVSAEDDAAFIVAAHDMAALIQAQAAELERLRADAERYRWLRAGRYPLRVAQAVLNDTPEGIDEYINAAIAAERKGAG